MQKLLFLFVCVHFCVIMCTSFSQDSSLFVPRIEQSAFTSLYTESESIEWFISCQAFSLSYDLVPPPRLVTHRKTEKERQLAGERLGKWGGQGAESYNRKKESPALYKSFNTLCTEYDGSACYEIVLLRDLQIATNNSVLPNILIIQLRLFIFFNTPAQQHWVLLH